MPGGVDLHTHTTASDGTYSPTELVAEATVALRLESTVEELIRTIHAHPTMAEAVGEA